MKKTSSKKQTDNSEPRTKKNIWLWVLGWLIIFPLPLTIILIRKNNMNTPLKYGIIAGVWIIYAAIAIGYPRNTQPSITENTPVERGVQMTNGDDNIPKQSDTEANASKSSTTEYSEEISESPNTSFAEIATISTEDTSETEPVTSLEQIPVVLEESTAETFTDNPVEVSIETLPEETSEASTEAPVIPESIQASVTDGHHIGDTLSAKDFYVVVIMSDGSKLENPPGWTANTLSLNAETTNIKVSYDTISTIVTVHASQTQAATEPPSRSINITSGLTFRRNQEATISINGQPGARYSIVVYYKSGPSDAEGLVDKVADANGNVFWTWHIGGRTTPGTYKVIISGNGEQITKEITILE